MTSIYRNCRFLLRGIFRKHSYSILLMVFTLSLLMIYKLKHLRSPIDANYQQRPECFCSRPRLSSSLTNIDEYYRHNSMSWCSLYATRRGAGQNVISISLFGPKEEKRFIMSKTIYYLQMLIRDVKTFYPGYLLRIYHDDFLSTEGIVCTIECQNPNVDFCSMANNSFIPPKIWRFIPAGDPLVDTMMSRDLDSAITNRERAAVDEWFTSGRLFHAMRDHPKHRITMLGGMWGFRPNLNRSLSQMILTKIFNQNLISKYTRRNDQMFLVDHIWPEARSSILVHDSFHCQYDFGHPAKPFPTQRKILDEPDCFIGCLRSYCRNGTIPFGPCPVQCRPEQHQDWVYC